MDQDNKQTEPLSVPVWVLLVVAAVCMLACGGLWTYVWVTRPAAVRQPTPTPIFVVIAPARTSTPILTATSLALDQSTMESTPTFPPPPVGSLIKVGANIQVVGTEQGLRLRYEPGLEHEVNYLAFDSEVFLVEDGPRQVDGLTWWFLVSHSDTTRNGWGASNYLQVIH